MRAVVCVGEVARRSGGRAGPTAPLLIRGVRIGNELSERCSVFRFGGFPKHLSGLTPAGAQVYKAWPPVSAARIGSDRCSEQVSEREGERAGELAPKVGGESTLQECRSDPPPPSPGDHLEEAV